MIAKVILPLALDQLFRYRVPDDLGAHVAPGQRVHVVLNNKHYTGIIAELLSGDSKGLKPLVELVDEGPILKDSHIDFWTWISEYYCCTIGEVMRAAFPSAMRLQFDSRIHLAGLVGTDQLVYSAEEQDLLGVLAHTPEMDINEAVSFFPKGKGLAIIHQLLEKGLIADRSFSKKPIKSKGYKWVYLTAEYAEQFGKALELCRKSQHQTNALLAYHSLKQQKGEVRMDEWLLMFGKHRPAVAALQKKGIIFVEESAENRYETTIQQAVLSDEQKKKLKEIKGFFCKSKPVLLHGVTGSGKTHIYSHLIAEQLNLGKQCLYLLPEVALTAQLTKRLRAIFKEKLFVFNHRSSNSEKMGIWSNLMSGQSMVILGTRSSIFLPYTDLSLIIVDEEHDRSYKQKEPNPRYHARDVALYMAQHYGASVLLGTATPSFESFHNAAQAKYSLVRLDKRYGDMALPDIELIDMKRAYKRGEVKGIFSLKVIEAIERVLRQNRQVIIFQNRRGFHTTVNCQLCSWVAECPNCDVVLTYHKYSDKIHCHLCGHVRNVPKKCPSCSNIILKQKGYGTERIQEEIEGLFAGFKVKRLDADTTRQKSSYERIIFEFSTHKVDILVGTQMVTKGLDFNHVGLVAVLQGDRMLYYPDFRAVEHCFQMLTQVAGRAGRKAKKGRVLIQSFDPKHYVFDYVKNNDYTALFEAEMEQRRQFFYPPVVRLILFELRHKKTEKLRQAVALFIAKRSAFLAKHCLGPASPQPSRIRSYYRKSFLIKMEKRAPIIKKLKKELLELRDEILRTKGLSQTRIIIEVDP